MRKNKKNTSRNEEYGMWYKEPCGSSEMRWRKIQENNKRWKMSENKMNRAPEMNFRVIQESSESRKTGKENFLKKIIIK